MTDPFAPASQPLTTDTSAFQRQMEQTTAATAALKAEFTHTGLAGKQFASAIGTAFEGLALKGKSLSDTVRTLAQSFSQIAFRAAFKPLEQAIGGGINSLIVGAGSFGTQLNSLQPNTPVPFAKGGVIASPMTFPLGQGTGLAGERGAEAIMPLTRGPDGSLGVAASGSGGVNVTFHVTATDVESFRRSETQVAALLARAVDRGQRNL